MGNLATHNDTSHIVIYNLYQYAKFYGNISSGIKSFESSVAEHQANRKANWV